MKHYKRGATWDGETPAICTRCRIERRPRANRGVVRATIRHVESKTKTPVAYCEEHIPGELEKEDT